MCYEFAVQKSCHGISQKNCYGSGWGLLHDYQATQNHECYKYLDGIATTKERLRNKAAKLAELRKEKNPKNTYEINFNM